MVNQNINISFEVSPDNALLLAMLINIGINNSQDIEKLITESSKNDLQRIGQEIIKQIAAKTDFDLLRLKNDLLGGIEQN